MSLSRWDEGGDSDCVTDLNRDRRLVGHGRMLAWQRVELPRYGREGAVEVRPFLVEKRPCVSMAQWLLGEAVKGNPLTTVIPGVNESKSSPRATEDSTEPHVTIPFWNPIVSSKSEVCSDGRLDSFVFVRSEDSRGEYRTVKTVSARLIS